MNTFCLAIIDVFRKEASDGSYYDTETFIGATEEELLRQVAGRCRSKWDWEVDYGFPPLPANDREAVTAYFAARKSTETYNELLDAQGLPKRTKRNWFDMPQSTGKGLWWNWAN